MTERRIISIALTENKTLEVRYSTPFGNNTGLITTAQTKSTAIVHSDLERVLQKLAPHLCVLCDTKEEKFVNKKNINETEPEKTNKIVVSGFSISGGGEDEVFRIHGQKLLKQGIMSMTNPPTKWADYEHQREIGELVESLFDEVNQYLDGTKFYAKQTELELDGEDALDEFKKMIADGKITVTAGQE